MQTNKVRTERKTETPFYSSGSQGKTLIGHQGGNRKIESCYFKRNGGIDRYGSVSSHYWDISLCLDGRRAKIVALHTEWEEAELMFLILEGWENLQ